MKFHLQILKFKKTKQEKTSKNKTKKIKQPPRSKKPPKQTNASLCKKLVLFFFMAYQTSGLFHAKAILVEEQKRYYLNHRVKERFIIFLRQLVRKWM